MATMENSERDYFNIDHSVGNGGYENIYGMDPALFNTSGSISQNPNSHQDLDNILGERFMNQLGTGSGLTPGFSPWNAQGTAYSPYPDMSYTALSVDQQPAGAVLGSGLIGNSFAQSFPEHSSIGMQAGTCSDNQSSVHINNLQETMGTQSESIINAEPAAKRKADTAAATHGAEPKPKKKRGPRKTKQKTEEEKRAKEERKLERNRMAASKCRQKKKVATERMMEDFTELERQNHWMKACLEEAKQDRNKILALLLEHKECNHAAIDKCLESQLARITEEFENPPLPGSSLFGMDEDAQQYFNSNASSPSNQSQSMSRRNSRLSITMSRSGSNASHQQSATVSHAAQSGPIAGYQSWAEQAPIPQGYQQQAMSKTTKTSHHYSPSSSSSTSMSRQTSSHSSVSQDHIDNQRNSNDSGISEIDTPPEERKKNMLDIPDDEGISLDAHDRVLRSRSPQMVSNQRIPNM